MEWNDEWATVPFSLSCLTGHLPTSVYVRLPIYLPAEHLDPNDLNLQLRNPSWHIPNWFFWGGFLSLIFIDRMVCMLSHM